MPYTTRAQIEAKLPPRFLLEALDDDGDGEEDENLFDTLNEMASARVDGYLGQRYAVPFTAPVPDLLLHDGVFLPVFGTCELPQTFGEVISASLARAEPPVLTPPANTTFPPEDTTLHIILPWYTGDSDRAIRLLTWIKDLAAGQTHQNPATLITDTRAPDELRAQILNLARQTFPNAQETLIPEPPTGTKWPAAQNWTFIQTARHLQKLPQQNPWLWFETDVAPCRQDWVKTLQTEYDLGKKPIMGYWVEAYDIINGVAIYPADFPNYIPRYNAQNPLKTGPFDCAMAPEIIAHTHPANHLMPNLWLTRKNGRPGLIDGQVPTWTPHLLDWFLTPNAVLLHRCKNGTLIDLLRQKLFPR